MSFNNYASTAYTYCVRGTRTQPLICVGCSVPYWVSCAVNKGGFFEIAFSSSSTHICLTLKCLLTFCLTLTRYFTWCFVCPRRSAEVWYSVLVKRSSFKKFAESSYSVHRSVFAESSKAFIFQKFSVNFYFGLSLHISQHGSSLTLENVCDLYTGACIKPGLVRLPLCHKVNILSCVAR